MPNARSVSKSQEGPVAVPKKEQAKPVPFLTGAQEKIADAIGELIVSGGTRRNLDLLCRIAADHEARRVYSKLVDKPAELERYVTERATSLAPQWYDELAAARANRQHLPLDIHPDPKTVTDLIRAQKRERLASEFENFLTGALPEEIDLMWHILTSWESQRFAWGDGFEAIYLANAFELQIQRRREYVRVPPHLIKDVESYIKALLKAQPAKETV